jgi:chemotaxis protein methyltransferase CheR
VAQELEFPDGAACIRWLLSSPLTQQQVATLASHLTTGETYFFREPSVFTMLEEEILPALMRARQQHARRLRFWSAGCATGEEPYSIAISINKVVPEMQNWHLTLLATDIKIQNMVTFAYLNLVDDVYPSLLTNTTAMDVIFCRNVLMYLAPEQATKVVHRLYHALADGGWLIVSPSEASQALFASFQTVNIPGAILYQKRARCTSPASNHHAVEYQVLKQHAGRDILHSHPQCLHAAVDSVMTISSGKEI